MSKAIAAAASGTTFDRIPPRDFRMLFESAPGLYLVLSLDLTIVAASDAYLSATMTQRHAVLGRGIFDVFPDNPDDPTVTGERNLRASLARVVRERVTDAMAVQEYSIRRPDAEGGGFEERFWSPVNSPVLRPDGGLAYIIHKVEDVTEFVRMKRRDAEQEEVTSALRSRGDRMETEIFQRAQQLQEANERLRLSNSDLEDRVLARTSELAQANEALRSEIRQTQLLEEQVRQAQKMEAIGTLAGGVAHDFNNLLTVICSCGDILLETMPPDAYGNDLVVHIMDAGRRAAALTNQLLAFSRQQVVATRVLDLNLIVGETERMLGRLIGEDIAINTVLAPNLGHIRADPSQMEQVIVNLAVNARDAMPQGGSLTIETSTVVLEKSYTQDRIEIEPGYYVLLAVSDTGCGMDEATRSRIFEPFFTTKVRGKGTGLGLATVFGSVKQSRGHIWVYSEPGHGTTFKVYLPVVECDITMAAAVDSHSLTPCTETVLVVEDETAVRGITVLALEKAGYTVLQASDGRDALRQCEAYAGPIHLLVSDVIMPEMGGRKVADAILALRPEIKVLYVSGYTDDAVVRHGILFERVAFLQKPFTPHSLAIPHRTPAGWHALFHPARRRHAFGESQRQGADGGLGRGARQLDGLNSGLATRAR